jgi:hypothetical protein
VIIFVIQPDVVVFEITNRSKIYIANYGFCIVV